MKNFLFSVLLSLGLVGSALAQATPPAPSALPVPGTGSSYVYTSASGHSVPYQLFSAANGLVYAVFDPSVSSADYVAAFSYLKSSTSNPKGIFVPVVAASTVNASIQTQETRVVVPFSVTSDTTLKTIPFSVATNLQTNGHYRFVARLYLNTGSGGSKIDVGGTCNTSNFVASYRSISTTSILYGGKLTSFLSGPGGSSTAATYVEINGELDVTNGGTLVIQFAQNASDPTPSTVLAGSTLTVTQIP